MLIHRQDMSRTPFVDVIRAVYALLRDQMVELGIKTIVADDRCVAFVIEVPIFNGLAVPYFPKDDEVARSVGEASLIQCAGEVGC
jgi:c-di-GMP-related signal transduction protein